MTSDGPFSDPTSTGEPSPVAHLTVPDDAVQWLAGEPRPGMTVLELHAGSGRLTAQLVRLGHRVIATDPSPHHLAALRSRVVPFAVGVAGTEAIPSPVHSVDAVICNPTNASFDQARALSEINRVLRPDGILALFWSERDESVPWVRKLTKLIGVGHQEHRLGAELRATDQFGEVEETSWRTWQRLNRDELLEYARASGVTDDGTLAAVGALYDDYDRGPDGLQMPYVVKGLRATVHHVEATPAPEQPDADPPVANDAEAEPAAIDPIDETEEPGTLLIDFS